MTDYYPTEKQKSCADCIHKVSYYKNRIACELHGNVLYVCDDYVKA